MHAPPALRGSFAARLATLLLGLVLCACGVTCFLESGLGLPPWDVLHQGVAERSGLSFGASNLLVSALVLALAASLRARIGLGTLLNATLIGAFLIVLADAPAIDALSERGPAVQVALLLLALPLFGAGSSLYICAAMGAGPRDSLMLVTSRASGTRIGVVRTALEVAVLALGYALGGAVGVGTLVFALGVGPAVEASFRLLARTPLVAAEVASAAA